MVSFVFRERGGTTAALKTGFTAVARERGALTPILDPEPDMPENRLNDGRCGPDGRFWVGSRNPGVDAATGSLYRFDPDFTCHRMDSGIIVANGMAFSPGGRTMVFGDSTAETYWKYDLDRASGTLSNKRIYLETHNLPWKVDGATFDAEGYYWGALLGDWSIGRFDPEGRLVRIIRLPVQHPTMCNFGGPDLDVLYVTSGTNFLNAEQLKQQPLAGALFAIHGVGVKGIPEPLFAG